MYSVQLYTQPTLGPAKWGLSENLQCKSPPFFTWVVWPPRLVQTKKAFGSGLYIPQRDTWGGSLILFWKGVFLEHSSPQMVTTLWPIGQKIGDWLPGGHLVYCTYIRNFRVLASKPVYIALQRHTGRLDRTCLHKCKCVGLFYNAIGAVAQYPYKWGVGSAFHRMKIHIYKNAQLG